VSTEKLYKIQNDTGWEIYFRPMTPQAVEVISFYQGDPFVNPRKLDTNPAMNKTKSTENVEVMIVEDARECWNLWVEHGDFEVAEVEDFLKGGRSAWEGEHINYRKSKKNKMPGKYMMDLHKKPERTRRRKQRVKSAMTGHDKLKRMNKE
jgi:hypothetical protein